MKLTLNPSKVNYSLRERRMFSFLSTRKRTSTVLMDLFYGDTVPFNGRKIVTGLLNGMDRKFEANGESFRIARTERNGPHAMEYWLEKAVARKKRRAA